MIKEKKQALFVVSALVVLSLCIGYVFNQMVKANNFLEDMIHLARSYIPKNITTLEATKSGTYKGMAYELVYFNPRNKSEHEAHFASVKLKDVSFLTCSLILNQPYTYPMNVSLDNKPVFFGSDWRCFKKLKHTMLVQFELFNPFTNTHMNEPKACEVLWDCDYENEEICKHNYCKKIKIK